MNITEGSNPSHTALSEKLDSTKTPPNGGNGDESSISSSAPLGFVYFIRAVGTGYVKIGFASRLSKIRLGSLQTGCPYELRLIGELRGSRFMEKAVHRLFRLFWVRGEWFEETGPLSAFIALATKAQGAGIDLEALAVNWRTGPQNPRHKLASSVVGGLTHREHGGMKFAAKNGSERRTPRPAANAKEVA